MTGKQAPTIERFWAKVERRGPGECWPWTAHDNGVGYGLLWSREHRRKITAHRYSYEVHHGRIPRGKIIMHSCDNPPCVNPAHLVLGTHKTNYDDSERKGRRNHVWNGLLPPKHDFVPEPPCGDDHWTRKYPERVQRGSENGFSKLTENQVRRIYALRLKGHKADHIARRFNLDPSTVGDIIKGECWSHMLGTTGCPTLEQLSAVKTSRAPNKLTTEQAIEIKGRIKSGEPIKPLAREFGVAFQTVSDIKRGKTWAFI